MLLVLRVTKFVTRDVNPISYYCRETITYVGKYYSPPFHSEGLVCQDVRAGSELYAVPIKVVVLI